MLDELLQESVNHLETEFYNKKFRFSYSSISKLLYSPQVFYQMYVLGHREEKISQNLLEGKVIHCLLLENNSFDKYFIVSPTSLPTGSSKVLIDNVYYRTRDERELNPDLKLEDCQNKVLEVLKSMNYYQMIKTDADRLAKVITPETKSYWEFLDKKGNKELIDRDTLKYCQDSLEVIKSYPTVMDLLGENRGDFDHVEVFNEEYLECDIKGNPFGFKGILDNLVVDHDKKIIFINDFKTSGKSLKDFKDTIEFYSYWIQATLYLIMVSHKYWELMNKGYELKFHFIVIDKYFNVYPFPVSDSTRNLWLERFTTEILPIVNYHYTNRRYELPYEFDNNLVIL